MHLIHSRSTSDPGPAESVPLVDSASGQPLRLRTLVSLEHDDEELRVTFDYDDDRIVASLTDRDSDLYTEDVLEVFLSPSRLEEYFEFEVNPLGALFDARVTSPERHRSTMTVDRSWNCDGLRCEIQTASDGSTTTRRTTLTIPFACLGVSSPARGERWRGNFYRIDRAPAGDSFAAWNPTLATPPDFHLPDRFGVIVF